MSRKFLKYRSILNGPQIEAVETLDGPVLVLAGAGTGKTRVITHRIALMIEKGVDPANIAGMTFTNKAASEMRERINEMISREDAAKVFLGTFHAFCSRILRREISVLGFTSSFTIADEADQVGNVREALAECGISKEDFNPAMCLSMISRAKSSLRTADDYSKDAGDRFEESIGSVYRRYAKMLENQNTLDFDDILLFTVRIFENHPEILRKYQNIYKYLLVDEYQDTNLAQFRILKLLAGEKMNLLVVGDDDQSIYGWRGANIKNILEFPKHFPGSKVIALEQNYRSTGMILDAANAVISMNSERHKKSLWSEIGTGEKIVVVGTDNEVAEAEFVAKKICQIYSETHGASYSDFAVLYRSNHQSRHFEDVMRSYSIPYRLVGSKSFYERKEIRDAVAYLKLAVNPRDDQSFLRIIGVPPRGVGDKAIETMKRIQASGRQPFTSIIGSDGFSGAVGGKAASESANFAERLHKWSTLFAEPGQLYDKAFGYLSEIGYMDGFIKLYKDRKEAEKRRENVFELLNMISESESAAADGSFGFRDFLEKYCLQDDNDKVKEEKGGGVSLMTVHAAKGLEFDHVFISGMELNVFPHERSMKDSTCDEERRLFYVAVTRAKRNLFISWARSRLKYGEAIRQEPSPFIEDLPEDCIVNTDSASEIRPMSNDDFNAQVSAFFKKTGFTAGAVKEKRENFEYYE